MNSQQAVERAVRRIFPNPNRETLLGVRSSALTLLPDALQQVGREVALGPHWEGLQKDFSVSPTAGLVDLTTIAGIIFEMSRSRVRISSSNLTLTPIDHYHTLQAGVLPNDQVYYAQSGTTLRFLGTDGSLATYVTALKITANYVPAITDITPQFEDAVVAALAERIISTMPPTQQKALLDANRSVQLNLA